MQFTYETRGTCCRIINFEVDKDTKKVSHIEFMGGCNGNLKMISKLVDGMTTDEIYEKCHGNLCRDKGTSCADQLACAMLEANEELTK